MSILTFIKATFLRKKISKEEAILEEQAKEAMAKEDFEVPLPPEGKCSYSNLSFRSGHFCGRELLAGNDMCFWHAKNIEKYKPEIIQQYFGKEQTLISAIEDEVAKGHSLTGAYLKDAPLGGGWFRRGANLTNADLRYANLSGAHLSYGSLNGARLVYADLENAYLGDVDIRNAYFTGASLYNVKFRNNDFTGVKGLAKECFKGYKWGVIPIYTILEKYPQYSKYAYRAMKIYFSQQGALGDASWAAYREHISARHILAKNIKPSNVIIDNSTKNYIFKKDASHIHLLKTSLSQWVHNLLSLMASYFSCYIFGYGEKPSRIIIFSALTILAYAFIYHRFDMLSEPSFETALYFSIVTFTTLGYGDLTPLREFRLLAASEAGIGLILVGLFLFVLSRRASGR